MAEEKKHRQSRDLADIDGDAIGILVTTPSFKRSPCQSLKTRFCAFKMDLKIRWKINSLFFLCGCWFCYVSGMPSTTTFVSWIGERDFKAAADPGGQPDGCPIAHALNHLAPSEDQPVRVILLHDPDDPTKHRNAATVVDWIKRTWLVTDVVHHEIAGDNVESSYAGLHERIEPVVMEALEADRSSPVLLNGSSGRPIIHGVFMTIAVPHDRITLLHCWRPGEVVPLDLPDSVLVDFRRESRARAVAKFTGGRKNADDAAEEFRRITGDSPGMTHAVVLAHRFATAGKEPILLLGETGAGKELFAEAIHAASPRGKTADGGTRPLVTINCGALPESLIESELFGHVKGAFTGADKDKGGLFDEANEGTIFLDEIGDLPLSLQVRLLRVLNDGEIRPVGSSTTHTVDVRIVAATHCDLRKMVADGTFRQDLWYRLAVCPIDIPPLRERGRDLATLIKLEWERIVTELEAGIDARTLSAGALGVLQKHDWPGNVRELKATLTRLAISSTHAKVTKQEAADAIQPVPSTGADGILNRSMAPERPVDLKGILNEVVGHYMERAYESAGTMTKAAQMLGIVGPKQTGGNTKFRDWARQYKVESLKKQLDIKDG